MICVDASVAAKWILEEKFSAQARSLYDNTALMNEELVAPTIFTMEVTNVLLKRVRRRDFGIVNDASERLATFLSMEVTLFDANQFHHDALAIADTFGLPAIYDAYYLALAADAQCLFWTDDQRLLGYVKDYLPYVRWIGEYGL